MIKITVRFALLIAGCVVVASCKSATEPPPSSQIQAPGAGSVFTYDTWATDTATGQTIQKWKTTFTVIASHLSEYGKTDVAEWTSDSVLQRTTLVNYEPNGDITFFTNSEGYPGMKNIWETIPIATKGSTFFTYYDTTYPNGKRYTRADNFIYSGEDTMRVGNRTFRTVKILLNRVDTLPTNYSDPNETLWFSPETGWWVRQDQQVYSSEGVKQVGRFTDLSAVSIK